MNIDIRPTALSLMQFTFDQEVRAIFISTSKLTNQFIRDPHVQRSASNVPGSPLRDWEAGQDALDRLAHVPSRSIHLTHPEARSALHLLSATTLHQIQRKRSVRISIQVLPWLAEASSCRIRFGALPPPETIWRVNQIPEDLKTFYEFLRSQRPRELEMSVLVADWFYEAIELALCHPQIKLLRNQLAAGSTPFRQAMRMALRAQSRRNRTNQRE
jgi:hypothetical protein